ncbi:MAG: hypothetical protein ACYCO0_05140 [Candidatus Micrarchaeaceae archaeon]
MAVTKCMSCGVALNGPAFYCDGCGNYLCRSCSIPGQEGGDMYTCPNCTGELSQVTF